MIYLKPLLLCLVGQILSISTKCKSTRCFEVRNYFLLTSASPNINIVLLVFIPYKRN